MSEKVFKVFCRDLCSVQYLSEGAGLDCVMARNNNEVTIVGHGNMFALTKNIETSAFQGSHDALMRDLRQLWSYGDFDSPQFLKAFEILNAFEIRLDRIFNVFQGLFFGFTLGDASF